MSELNGKHTIIDMVHDRLNRVEDKVDNTSDMFVDKITELTKVVSALDEKVKALNQLGDNVEKLCADVQEIKLHYGTIKRSLKLFLGFVVSIGTFIATKMMGLIHIFK